MGYLFVLWSRDSDMSCSYDYWYINHSIPCSHFVCTCCVFVCVCVCVFVSGIPSSVLADDNTVPSVSSITVSIIVEDCCVLWCFLPAPNRPQIAVHSCYSRYSFPCLYTLRCLCSSIMTSDVRYVAFSSVLTCHFTLLLAHLSRCLSYKSYLTTDVVLSTDMA